MNFQEAYRRTLKSAYKAVYPSTRSKKQIYDLIRTDFDDMIDKYNQSDDKIGIFKEFNEKVKQSIDFYNSAGENLGKAHKVVKNLTDIHHSHTNWKGIRQRRKTLSISRWNAQKPPVEAAAPESKQAHKSREKHLQALDRMYYINAAPLYMGEVIAQAENTSGIILGKLRRPMRKLPE
ncbi:hypothetical protein E3Q17_01047 [Wallemia mellicola]|uniref:Uncharacterized protein n=1 Tax=Wallemia mellicola TaxID=1708541 RepID=A0A4T0NZD1_9BASI|nr:hypothetical protein E3Q17_01047 [Wallemia mellicola]